MARLVKRWDCRRRGFRTLGGLRTVFRNPNDTLAGFLALSSTGLPVSIYLGVCWPLPHLPHR